MEVLAHSLSTAQSQYLALSAHTVSLTRSQSQAPVIKKEIKINKRKTEVCSLLALSLSTLLARHGTVSHSHSQSSVNSPAINSAEQIFCTPYTRGRLVVAHIKFSAGRWAGRVSLKASK